MNLIYQYLEGNIRARLRRYQASHSGQGRKNIHQLHHVFYNFAIWKREVRHTYFATESNLVKTLT